MHVKIHIRRFDPERSAKPYWAHYDVEVEPTDRLLDALNYIKGHIDGSLAYRRSCAHGICGSDAMMINGVNRLACKVLIKELGSDIRVGPLTGLKVLKDLIVDMEPFFESYRVVKPYLIVDESELPDREQLQTPEQRQRFDDTTKCILCGACTTSCPVFWSNGRYIGPAAIVAAHRFIFDSRDRGADRRLEILGGRDGAFRCRTIFNCTEACPRGIQVTRAIQEVKQAIVERGF
ncbi:MAG: succinate dehydrogenase iron-sulfur subunit [Bacillota bacterium]